MNICIYYNFILYVYFFFLVCYTKGETTNNGDGSQAGISAPMALNVISSTITSKSFLAKWTKVTGVGKYLLYVANDNQFTQFLTGFAPLEVTDTSVLVNNLTANSAYYFRVKAVINTSESTVSNTIAVSTIAKQWMFTIFAGTLSSFGGFADGQGPAARLYGVNQLPTNPSGNVYIYTNLAMVLGY